MGDTPADGSNRPVAPPAPHGTAPAHPRSPAPRAQERRRALVIGCSMLVLAALTAAVVITTGSPMSGHALKSPQIAAAMPDGDLRTAKITKDSDGKDCWQQIFDNQTGRMTRTQQPCDTTAYDSNGAPIPVGTIHRLDAISKSFSGH